MKTLAKLGDWFLFSSPGPVLFLMLMALSVLAYIWSQPANVVLSAEEFICVEAEPQGLETRCVIYRRRGK